MSIWAVFFTLLAFSVVGAIILVSLMISVGYINFSDENNEPEHELPPVGWWARCAYTGKFHKIVAHDFVSTDPMALTVGYDGYWGAYDYHWSEWQENRPDNEDEIEYDP